MVNHSETLSEHIAREENPFLSIVVPVYNEEENVRPLFEKIQAVCEEIYVTYEVLFVDDGSRDATFAVLSALHEELCSRFQSEAAGESHPVGAISKRGVLRVLRFEKNAGQTAAMAAGFEYARGEYIVSMDGDLQNDPVDIPRMLRELDKGYDLVCGWRKDRQDKFWTRRVPSVAANWIIAKITGIPIHDNGCSLKAYRASVIKQVPLYGEMHRFIPLMSRFACAIITEVAVTHHPRRFGESKYGLGRVWRVILDIVAFVFILISFPVRSEDPRFSALRRKNPKTNVWLITGCLSIPFLILGGRIALTDPFLLPMAVTLLVFGFSMIGIGLITSRALTQAQRSADLGMLARFFKFFCKRRPLRVFGPIGVLLFVSGCILPPLSGGTLIIYVTKMLVLLIALIKASILVFWFGLFGELVSFANADKVKDYKVATLLGS